MKKTGKRLLALVMALCLTLALGTTAHAAAQATTVTGEVTGGTAQAGKQITQITLTATDSAEFAESLEPATNYFTIQDVDAGIQDATVAGATRQPESLNKVTLTVEGCTPTKQGTFTVTAKQDAFAETRPEGDLTTAGISVTAADKPELSVTSSNLTAGKESGTIQLSITSGGNEFAAGNENYEVADGLSVTNVSPSGTAATLTVSGTPSAGGSVTVTVKPAGFKYQPSENATVSANVDYPTVSSVTVSGGPLTAGQQASFTVSIEGSEFETSPDNTAFTLSGCDVTQPDSVTGDGKTATLWVTPKSSGSITVTKIETTAFKYKPSGAVESGSISGFVTVKSPNVTASASGDLTQGNGGNITVQITSNNDTFKSDLSKTDAGLFTVKVANNETLTATEISGGGSNTATLTVPAPATTGAVSVTISKGAFTTEAEADVTAVSTAAVKTPTVTSINAKLEGTLTAGVAAGSAKITLTAEGTANFKNSLTTTDNITLSGDGVNGLSFEAVGSGQTATLTLTGTPTQAGAITITVNESAFTYAPGSVPSVTGDITVSAPTGGVSAQLTGGTASLTAGTAAGETKIKLTATDTLNFKNKPDLTTASFSLTGGDGLTIKDVEYTDNQNILLTLEGTPKAGGTFTVTVQTSAFVAAPDPDKEVTTNSLNIAYPKINLTAAPSHIIEDTEVSSITLTATNGAFNAIDADSSENFTFSGNTDIKLTHIKAEQGSDQAILTVTGKAETANSLTINVKKAAFVYAPETEPLTATVTVGQPTGELSAELNGNLYAGTSADGTTITLTITGSQGLHFKDSGLATTDFALEGTKDGLEIKSVARVSETEATLTLSGTPSAAGSFQVKALKDSAFMAAPAADKTSGNLTIGEPNVVLTVSENTLQAGVEDGSVTVTITGSKFVSDLTDKITLNGGADFADLKLGEVTRNGDDSVTVTVTGTPAVKGEITLEFKTDAFDPAPTAAVSVKVPVAKGEQAADPVTEEGAPGINIGTPMDTLAGAVLTDDELELYEKGAEVLIELVESPDALVPAGDKTLVEEAAGDYTVGEYLDVSLYKTINGDTDSVRKTKTPIRVVFTIPEDLRAAGRQFAVVRVHEGKAELLKTVASSASTITVESDLFSTYAIVYREAPKTDAPGSTNAPGTVVPGTGDGTALLGWAALLLGCGAALVPAVFVLRRRDRG